MLVVILKTYHKLLLIHVSIQQPRLDKLHPDVLLLGGVEKLERSNFMSLRNQLFNPRNHVAQ